MLLFLRLVALLVYAPGFCSYFDFPPKQAICHWVSCNTQNFGQVLSLFFKQTLLGDLATVKSKEASQQHSHWRVVLRMMRDGILQQQSGVEQFTSHDLEKC